MEKKELRWLKKHLEKQLIDCIELKEKNDLTKEGRGMLGLLLDIFARMEWEIPKIKKMCEMNKEENLFWEKTYKDYVEEGVHANILHELVNKATKERFPRLKEFDVLY